MRRYLRNLQLEGFDEDSQLRLGSSRVAVIGAGALGSVVAMYLAGSGTGHLRIADFDTIDLTNLQRQVFYREDEIGKSKVKVLKERIESLNSDTTVEIFSNGVSEFTIDSFVCGFDIIAECSDNEATKSMVVEAGRRIGVPVVLGGVKDYQGQVVLFNNGSVSYSDLFPSSPMFQEGKGSDSGVFGPVPGVVGALQASEIIQRLLTVYDGNGFLLSFDTRTMQFEKFKF